MSHSEEVDPIETIILSHAPVPLGFTQMRQRNVPVRLFEQELSARIEFAQAPPILGFASLGA